MILNIKEYTISHYTLTINHLDNNTQNNTVNFITYEIIFFIIKYFAHK